MFLIWVLVEIAELHGPTSLAYLTITAFRFRLSLLRKINVWHLRNNTPVTLCSPYICTHKCMYTYTHICIYTHALHYTISLSKSLCVSYLMARGKKSEFGRCIFALTFGIFYSPSGLLIYLYQPLRIPCGWHIWGKALGSLFHVTFICLEFGEIKTADCLVKNHHGNSAMFSPLGTLFGFLSSNGDSFLFSLVSY